MIRRGLIISTSFACYLSSAGSLQFYRFGSGSTKWILGVILSRAALSCSVGVRPNAASAWLET